MFEKIFYLNDLYQWSIAFLIILGSVITSKLFFRFLKYILDKYLQNNKFHFDDIIITSINKPISFAIILIGIYYALKTLKIDESFFYIIDKSYDFLLVFIIAWIITSLISKIADIYIYPVVEKSDTNLDDQMIPIVIKGLKLIVWALALVIGLDNAGYHVSTILAGLGIGGLAVAMAAKDTISNIFGSFVIFADRPFVKGDIVNINGITGTISDVGLRSTRLKTFDNRIVTIANSEVVNEHIENISSEPSRRIVIYLSLTYDTSYKQIQLAKNLLKKIVKDNDYIENTTDISFESFGDYSLNIRFVYFIKKDNGSFELFKTKDSVNIEILRLFNENNLNFAFPTQTLHFNSIKSRFKE